MACTFPTSATSVEEWLDAINMGRYKTAFSTAQITLDSLHGLTEDRLQSAGVSMVGHRKRLIQATKALEPAKPPPPPMPEPVMSMFGARAGFSDVSLHEGMAGMDVEMSPAPFVMGSSLGAAIGGVSGGAAAAREPAGVKTDASGIACIPPYAGPSSTNASAMDVTDGGSANTAQASERQQASQQKANSTSSIYISSTLVKPDTDEVVFCIAAVIHDRIQQGEAQVRDAASAPYRRAGIPESLRRESLRRESLRRESARDATHPQASYLRTPTTMLRCCLEC